MTNGGEVKSIIVNADHAVVEENWGALYFSHGKEWLEPRREYSHLDDKLEGSGGSGIEVKTHQKMGSGGQHLILRYYQNSNISSGS